MHKDREHGITVFMNKIKIEKNYIKEYNYVYFFSY